MHEDFTESECTSACESPVTTGNLRLADSGFDVPTFGGIIVPSNSIVDNLTVFGNGIDFYARFGSVSH